MHHPGTLVITGLGLMGGSAAAAASAAGWRVRLHHRRPEVADAAAQRGWGTAYADLAAAAADADLALIGAPAPAVPDLARALLAAGPGLIVTDLASTKRGICAALAAEGRAGRFVGSHPMCGSHHQGLQHADPDLYRAATVVLTPEPGTPAAATAAVQGLWESLGGRCHTLAADSHDRAVASASHLPHVLAATSAALLCDDGAELAATGFRDTSRVAAASPRLWRDILQENRHAVRDLLAVCREHLATLDRALAADDAAAIEAWLETGRAGRERFDRRRGD